MKGTHVAENRMTKSSPERVAKNTQAARLARGWSLPELTKRAGIAQVTLYEFEQGRRTPRLNTLYKIAEALGVQDITLMHGTEADVRRETLAHELSSQWETLPEELQREILALLLPGALPGADVGDVRQAFNDSPLTARTSAIAALRTWAAGPS